jgi:hypothetical protein
MPKTTFALLALALVAVTSACNVAPGATPTPSVPPTPTPVPTPTPSPTFGPDQISHPTGAHDVVLRIEQGGGFVPFGFLFTQSPTFTLYGDGTVILKPIDTRQNDPFGGQAFLPWVVGHMSESDMQALLQFALSTGRLANAKADYNDGGIADAPSTFFTINAGGVDKKVNVYALGIDSGNSPDAADRQGFNQLATLLNDFTNQSGVDLGDLAPYDPTHYAVQVAVGMGDPVGQAVDWPWTGADGAWDNWKPKPDEGFKTGTVDRQHVADLGLDVPNGGHVGIWVKAPDGTFAQVTVRSLLPEQIDEFLNGSGG